MCKADASGLPDEFDMAGVTHSHSQTMQLALSRHGEG